jgi:hypothetical protein
MSQQPRRRKPPKLKHVEDPVREKEGRFRPGSGNFFSAICWFELARAKHPYKKMPATAALSKVATKPTNKARMPSLAKSLRRSGAIAPIPPN